MTGGIRTRYLGPSATRGSRIIATWTDGTKHRVVRSYNRERSALDNHKGAAEALAVLSTVRDLGVTYFVGEGCVFTDGYVFLVRTFTHRGS